MYPTFSPVNAPPASIPAGGSRVNKTCGALALALLPSRNSCRKTINTNSRLVLVHTVTPTTKLIIFDRFVVQIVIFTFP